MTTMSYDRFLSCIGEFGLAQKRILIMSVLIEIAAAVQILIGIFIMAVPDFRCAIPGMDNDTYHVQNEQHAQLLNESIPYDSKKYRFSECQVFSTLMVNWNTSNATYGSDRVTEKCKKWVYSQDIYESTLVTDLDMVCDRQIFTTHANMMTMAGFMVSSVIAGILADLFGRKRVTLLGVFIVCVSTICLTFVKHVSTLLVMRFIISAASMCIFLSIFVLCTEFVGPKKRARAGMLIMIGWVTGMFVLGVVAYLLRDWRHLQLTMSCPIVLFVFYWWLMPESPRWLLNKGKNEEAKKVFMQMAKINKVELPEKMLPISTDDTDTKDTSVKSVGLTKSILLVIKSPTLLIRIFILIFNWLVCTLAYYGLTLNVGAIVEGDLYLNYFILTVMEGLGYFVTLLLLDRVGRKILYCSNMFLGALACLGIIIPIVTNAEAAWINVMLSNVGKFGITCCFAIVWLYTAELIPTSIRNTGIGACSFVGRIGGIISPYIANVHLLIEDDFGKALPLVIFGTLALVAAVLALFLPETLNKRLPETVADAEQIKR